MTVARMLTYLRFPSARAARAMSLTMPRPAPVIKKTLLMYFLQSRRVCCAAHSCDYSRMARTMSCRYRRVDHPVVGTAVGERSGVGIRRIDPASVITLLH